MKTLRFVPLFVLLTFFALSAVRAQQPFVTDDADVTEKGKFHYEVADELDNLQPTSLPVEYQNGVRATVAYGLLKDVEVSIGGQFLTLVSQPRYRSVSGIGDTTLAFKYNFRHEQENSRLPALTISGFVQLATGNAARSLGSGVTDYGFNAIAQKTYRTKNVFRVNGGYLFAGNTLNGALGIAAVRGHVFNGGASYIRKINEKLQLGAELTGAVTSNFQLSKGQLQTQFGGNYQLTKKTSFDFGLIVGRYSASPRFGFQLGYSRDF